MAATAPSPKFVAALDAVPRVDVAQRIRQYTNGNDVEPSREDLMHAIHHTADLALQWDDGRVVRKDPDNLAFEQIGGADHGMPSDGPTAMGHHGDGLWIDRETPDIVHADEVADRFAGGDE